jgi:hypothetical protein
MFKVLEDKERSIVEESPPTQREARERVDRSDNIGAND